MFGIAYDIVVGLDIVADALVFDNIIVFNVAIVSYNIAYIVDGIAITFTCFWWGDIQACIFPFPCLSFSSHNIVDAINILFSLIENTHKYVAKIGCLCIAKM